MFSPTAKENNGGRFIENTVKKFKDLNNFHILISPEGTLKKVPWRSGYYHLAKELKVPINIVGFNYVTHETKFVRSNIINESLEVSEAKLKSEFEKIIPLYPECSEVKIVTNEKTTIFGHGEIKKMIFVFFATLMCNWIVYKTSEILFYIILLCFSIWFTISIIRYIKDILNE